MCHCQANDKSLEQNSPVLNELKTIMRHYDNHRCEHNQFSQPCSNCCTCRMDCNCAGVNDDSKSPFSYQNRSPFRKLLNCCAIMQANTGPTSPPITGRSAKPPTNKSISSTLLYARCMRSADFGPTTRSKSLQSMIGVRPHGSRHCVYAGCKCKIESMSQFHRCQVFECN